MNRGIAAPLANKLFGISTSGSLRAIRIENGSAPRSTLPQPGVFKRTEAKDHGINFRIFPIEQHN
jgi:hypothetical protein